MEGIDIKQEFLDNDSDEEQTPDLKMEVQVNQIKVEVAENELANETKIVVLENKINCSVQNGSKIEQNDEIKIDVTKNEIDIEVPEYQWNYNVKVEVPEQKQDDEPKVGFSNYEQSDDSYLVEIPRRNSSFESPPAADEMVKVDKEYYNIHEVYDCVDCSIRFPTRTDIVYHFRMHKAVEMFSCAICETNFKTNSQLIAHKKLHIAEKRTFKCEKCDSTFTDHYYYLTHMINHTKNDEKMIKCRECHSYFSTLTIEMHYLCHSDRRLYCKLCKKVFKNDFTFNRDLKSHESSIECVECGKLYRDKTRLKYHMSCHTGVKLFQCYYCGKAFDRPFRRNIHMKTHMYTREHKCEVCDEMFYRYDEMKTHMNKKHSVIQALQCNYCQKVFYEKSTLTMHIYSHMGIIAYPCSVCDNKKIFTTYEDLKKHSVLKHKTFQCECKLH